jgi:hypothetical protein
MEIGLLEPFDNSTIIEGEVAEELIFVNFITGLEVGTFMPPNAYINELAKDPTEGQRVNYTSNGSKR